MKNTNHTRYLLVYLLLLADVILIISAISISMWKGEDILTAFDEGHYMTYLSVLKILIVSALFFILYVIKRRNKSFIDIRSLDLIWLIMGIAFIYLALDELFMVHETLDSYIHSSFKLNETGLTDRLDDFILIAYAVFGMMILYLYRSEILKHRKALPLLILAFITIFVGEFFDLLTNRNDIAIALLSQQTTIESEKISGIPYMKCTFVANSNNVNKFCEISGTLEESCEMITSTFLICFAYYCLIETKKQERSKKALT